MRIIAGEWGGRTIQAPDGREVRPTSDRVREAWMGSIGPRVESARVLDLFAGSGALGLEALSRGAAEAVFVEKSRKALEALRKNIESLGAEDRSTVVESDAFSFLGDGGPGGEGSRGGLRARGPFDLALADPPYDRGFAERLVDAFVRAPFARELWVEHRTKEKLPAAPGLRQRRYGDTTLSILEAP